MKKSPHDWRSHAEVYPLCINLPQDCRAVGLLWIGRAVFHTVEYSMLKFAILVTALVGASSQQNGTS
jgi:hypothetical protein